MNQIQEVLEWLEKPVDIKRLVRELAFSLEDFEEANRLQPRLFLEAGRYLTGAVLQKSRAETQLETQIAKEGLTLRELKASGKRGTITDKGIADMVNSNDDVLKLKRKVSVANANEVWAKQLLKAYDQRLTVLSNITKIRTGEMATELRAVKERSAISEMRRTVDRIRPPKDV
jgi:hypothetical protein